MGEGHGEGIGVRLGDELEAIVVIVGTGLESIAVPGRRVKFRFCRFSPLLALTKKPPPSSFSRIQFA